MGVINVNLNCIKLLNYMRICSVEGCENKHYSLNFCHRHYDKFKLYGDPLSGRQGEPLKYINNLLNKRNEIQKDINNCIIWPFGVNGVKNNYGHIKYNKKNFTVGRYICFQLYGKPPIDQKGNPYVAGHLCATTNCCNPWHFNWITQKQNLGKDKGRDGTLLIGEKNPRSKLLEEEVIEIFHSKKPYKEIAEEFNISESNIRDIKTRRSWKHLDL